VVPAIRIAWRAARCMGSNVHASDGSAAGARRIANARDRYTAYAAVYEKKSKSVHTSQLMATDGL
jgi:hypothetical protein